MKKFDLAIYEVEEMNQKELTEVNGGVAFWTIAGVIIAFVALVYTIYRDSRPPQTIHTTDPTPPPYEINAHITIDSITVAPGYGYTITGNGIDITITIRQILD